MDEIARRAEEAKSKAADISEAGKIRLARVYKALVKERPGDSNALAYLNEFDREIAKAPVPKAKDADPARLSHRDGSFGLGHCVHGCRNQGNFEFKMARKLGIKTSLVRKY